MIDLKIVLLEEKRSYECNTGINETVIVLLTGKCDVIINNGEYLWKGIGARFCVFDNPSDSVYIPTNTAYKIIPQSDSLKFAAVSTYGEHKYEPFIVRHDDVKCEIRGLREWKRSVYDIITSKHKVNSLIIGETIHTDGVWSGYPPHKHDTDDGTKESLNNEVYYVEMLPTNTFAIFLQYGDGWEKTTILRNGDSISVTEGYHAVVSAGGAKFYYLWALDSRDHRFYCNSDENYQWVTKL